MRQKRLSPDEILERTGTKGEAGRRDAKRYFEEAQKAEETQKNDTLTKLQMASSGRVITYNRLLAQLLLEKISSLGLPSNWQRFVSDTPSGVVVEIKSPRGEYYRSAFKATGLPEYDLNAVELFAVRVENTIERVEHDFTENTS